MIIYLLTNRTNGKYYVGQTTQPLCDRLRQHAADAQRKTGRLQQAIRKYGIDTFDVEILARASSYAELDELEKLWIAISGADKSGIGYNSTSGGKRFHMTDEVRSKLSAAHAGKHLSEAHKAKLRGKVAWNRGTKGLTKAWNKGISASPEEKERLIQMRRAQTMTPERRARISTTMKGRMPSCVRPGTPARNRGVPHSPETIEKLRQIAFGRKATPETRLKMSLAQKGRLKPRRQVAVDAARIQAGGK